MSISRSLKPSFIAVSLIAIVAFIGGGIAHAAATSSPDTVKVCVTSENAVRSATSKGNCPDGTSAISINRAGRTGAKGATGMTGPAGPRGLPGATGPKGASGKGAAQAIASKDSTSAVTFPMVAHVPDRDSKAPPLDVASVPVTITAAGFYTVKVHAALSGTKYQIDWTCSDNAYDGPSVDVTADGSQAGSFGSTPATSAFEKTLWFEPGAHKIEIKFQQAGCLSNDFSGTLTVSSTNIRVYND